jgi:glycosidase
VNVAAQGDDPVSILSFYRRLIWFRKSSPALLGGTYRALDSPADTFVYLREHADQRLLVALNFAAEPRTLALPAGRDATLLLSTAGVSDSQLGSRIELGATQGIIARL